MFLLRNHIVILFFLCYTLGGAQETLSRGKLEDTKVVYAKDGVIMLFQKTNGSFGNAFTFLVKEGVAKNRLLELFNKKNWSYVYGKTFLHLYRASTDIFVVVDNMDGKSLIRKKKIKNPIVVKGLGYLYGNQFSVEDIDENKEEAMADLLEELRMD